MNFQEKLEKNFNKALNPFSFWQRELRFFKNRKNNDQLNYQSIIEKNPLKKNSIEQEENIKNDFDVLNQEIQKCFNCPLGEKMKGKEKISLVKNSNSKIMILCDMPHYEDQEVNKNFFSNKKISEVIEKILYSLKISKELVYFSSVLKCHSLVQKEKKIFENFEEYSYCEKHLKKELQLLPNINFIIVFGEVAYKLLTKKKKFQTDRGKIFNYSQKKIFFTDTIQNALLSSEKKINLWEDFKRNNFFQSFNF